MSNRYTAKVSESLKLRGWIDEIQAKALRADNARLDIELREAKCATDFANLACDRKDAEIARLKGEVEALEKRCEGHWVSADNHSQVVADLLKTCSTLATYKAAVIEARAALMSADQFMRGCDEKHFIELREKALHTLSALTGDATKPT